MRLRHTEANFARLRLLLLGTLAVALGVMTGAAAFAGAPLPEFRDMLAAEPYAVDLGGEPTGWDSGWVTHDATVTVAVDPDDGGARAGFKSWRAGQSEPADYALAAGAAGAWQITDEGETMIAAAAVAGSEAFGRTTRTVRIDRTPPKIRFSTSAPLISVWTSQTVPVTISVEDTASGPAGEPEYRLFRNSIPIVAASGSRLTVESEGRYALDAEAQDVAGNPSSTHRTMFGIDKTKPITRLKPPAAYYGRAYISLDATDTYSGVAKTYYQLDSGPIREGDSLVVTMTPGALVENHTLSFWSVDLVGNTETTTAASHNVPFKILADTRPPVTVATASDGSDPGTWHSRPVMIALRGDDGSTGAGVAHTLYRVGGSRFTTYTAPFAVANEGSTLVEFYSVDRNENAEAIKRLVVRVDSARPASSFVATQTYDTEARVAIEARDALSGVASVWTWVGTEAPVRVLNDSLDPAVFRGVATSRMAGTHQLNYLVVDGAGNREETRTVTVHVVRPPTFSLSTKTGNLANTSSPAKTTLSGRLIDGKTAVAGRRVTLEYSPLSSFAGARQADTTTTATGAFAFSATLSGKMYYRFVFEGDTDFKSARSKSVRLTPRVGLTTPKAGSKQKAGRTFSVTGRMTPAHSSKTRIYIKRYLWSSRSNTYVYKGRTGVYVTPRSGYSVYNARVKLGAGKWRLAAYAAPDTYHAKTTSKYVTVTVR